MQSCHGLLKLKPSSSVAILVLVEDLMQFILVVGFVRCAIGRNPCFSGRLNAITPDVLLFFPETDVAILVLVEDLMQFI